MQPTSAAFFRPKNLLFAAIGIMFVYVMWNSEGFLFNSADPEWKHIASFKWWLLPHGLGAACALILGPMQFSDRLRQRYAKLHRVTGRIYIAGVFIGAPLGAYIQYFEESLLPSQDIARSFTVATLFDAGLWMMTTGIALMFILKGKTQLHRQWMTRSFAAALIFLEVRLIIGLTGWERYVEAIVWGCVAAAIPLADLVIQWQEYPRSRPAPLKARAAGSGA